MTDEWMPDIERLQAFDEDEWARVERTFAGRLIAYIARRVKDPEWRDDVVQEVFLGAVRGIDGFDRRYTFEQYLFGICRNRTIDHMRRRKVVGQGEGGDDEDMPTFRAGEIASEDDPPSRIVRRGDLESKGRELLRDSLRQWVQETWAAGEFTRLMVVEALVRGGWRNRDTWQRFDLRDETAVAGIKFRALKKLREIAEKTDESGELTPALAELAEDGEIPIDVAKVWTEERVSCPARHWLARGMKGALDPGPKDFVELHVDEIGCEWCQANRDDLARRDEEQLEPLLRTIEASTAKFLRSRRLG